MSNFWKRLFELSGTTLHHTTACQPQFDGQSEVVNRGLEQYLGVFTHDKPSTWVTFLSWAEFSYNSNYHSGLKTSPFEALFGRPTPTIPAYTMSSTSIQALDEMLRERDALLCSLKDNLHNAQPRMQQRTNLHWCELELAVGDIVFVRLQPYRQTSVAKRCSNKLAKRYYGPFSITKRVGPVAYRLAIPPESKIHPVFHISMLKPFHETNIPTPCPLP